jgi:hypothetical protein
MTDKKKTAKELTAEANRMSAVEKVIDQHATISKLTKDRRFLMSKTQALEKVILDIDESDKNLFEDENQGMRLEFSYGYRDSIIKISNEWVIRAFIKYITEQMVLKVDEIDEQIIAA